MSLQVQQPLSIRAILARSQQILPPPLHPSSLPFRPISAPEQTRILMQIPMVRPSHRASAAAVAAASQTCRALAAAVEVASLVWMQEGLVVVVAAVPVLSALATRWMHQMCQAACSPAKYTFVDSPRPQECVAAA